MLLLLIAVERQKKRGVEADNHNISPVFALVGLDKPRELVPNHTGSLLICPIILLCLILLYLSIDSHASPILARDPCPA